MFYPRQVKIENETWVVEVVSRTPWLGGLRNVSAQLLGGRKEC